MDKKNIKDFFDSIATNWDNEPICEREILNIILDNAGITDAIDVLDVGCGTGVLFPYYHERNVNSITAIDLSPQMVKIAKAKFPFADVICGDAENTEFSAQFDTVMIYNAFPHFPNPKRLIANLAKVVKSDGKLCVAHGLSKADLDRIHKESASTVSLPLPEADALAKIFEQYFTVDTIISNDKMYQVVGTKR